MTFLGGEAICEVINPEQSVCILWKPIRYRQEHVGELKRMWIKKSRYAL
tara:strand:+ start:16491 stop:16637 length:147 start_codon:yes stop_codon:yes gene_type:complete